MAWEAAAAAEVFRATSTSPRWWTSASSSSSSSWSSRRCSRRGWTFSCPTTDNPDKKPEGSKQRLISVKWETPPKYFIDTKWFPPEEFQRALDELYQRAPTTELVIKADQRLTYGEVKKVMRMTKDAGFEDVGLIAEKKAENAHDSERTEEIFDDGDGPD